MGFHFGGFQIRFNLEFDCICMSNGIIIIVMSLNFAETYFHGFCVLLVFHLIAGMPMSLSINRIYSLSRVQYVLGS